MQQLSILGESLEIANVAACREEWFKSLRSGGESVIRLNVDHLKHIDTAGLQLLLAFGKHASENGCKISLSGNSDVLRKQAAILGLTSPLFDSLSSSEQGN